MNLYRKKDVFFFSWGPEGKCIVLLHAWFIICAKKKKKKNLPVNEFNTYLLNTVREISTSSTPQMKLEKSEENQQLFPRVHIISTLNINSLLFLILYSLPSLRHYCNGDSSPGSPNYSVVDAPIPLYLTLWEL